MRKVALGKRQDDLASITVPRRYLNTFSRVHTRTKNSRTRRASLRNCYGPNPRPLPRLNCQENSPARIMPIT
jgi:hypothetical protein